jgi:hypothetical protein
MWGIGQESAVILARALLAEVAGKASPKPPAPPHPQRRGAADELHAGRPDHGPGFARHVRARRIAAARSTNRSTVPPAPASSSIRSTRAASTPSTRAVELPAALREPSDRTGSGEMNQEEAIAQTIFLRDLASSTGGSRAAQNDFQAEFDRLALPPEYVYYLGFYPEGTQAGREVPRDQGDAGEWQRAVVTARKAIGRHRTRKTRPPRPRGKSPRPCSPTTNCTTCRSTCTRSSTKPAPGTPRPPSPPISISGSFPCANRTTATATT